MGDIIVGKINKVKEAKEFMAHFRLTRSFETKPTKRRELGDV